MADLGNDYPESSLCRVNGSRTTRFPGRIQMVLCTLLLLADRGGATTHWVVTEDGKIQQQVRSYRLTAHCRLAAQHRQLLAAS